MHARKQPRVNDGYTERKDAHLQQWLDRHQGMQHQQRSYGALYSEGSPAEGSHGHGNRADSPGSHPSPRYQHKDPYLERNKEKRGSLGLAEKKVSQYLATGSIGQNVPGTHRDYREHRSDGNHHGEGNNGQDKQFTPASGSGNTSRRSTDHKDGKDHRAEQVQKSAVRVYGDWSEHISSSGKRYYYNCKTEVSQWEKPKEWHDGGKPPDRSRDIRTNAKPSSSATSRNDERTRHSSTSEQQRYESRSRTTPSETSVSATSDKHSSQKPSERPKTLDTSNASSTPGSSASRGNSLQRSNSAAESPNSHSLNHKGHGGYGSHSGLNAHPELKRNSVYPYGSSSVEPAKRRSRHESDSSRMLGHASQRDEGGQQDELEASPGSTPTSSSRPSSCAAIQTLQELQKALTIHIKKQQSKGGSQAVSSSSGTTSAQLQTQLANLQHNILQQLPLGSQSTHSTALTLESPHQSSMTPSSHMPDDGAGRELHARDGGSPVSDMTSPRSSCRSPTPSTGSSQNAPALGSSALSAMALKSQQSVTLTPSLSNYYNEKLIGHVLGWHGEQLERQADRFRQEALAVGSLHLSRVAVELKRARSNVRIAEIQSTIHEQRVLVLQQQRTEIETLKPPTSLLPS